MGDGEGLCVQEVSEPEHQLLRATGLLKKLRADAAPEAVAP